MSLGFPLKDILTPTPTSSPPSNGSFCLVLLNAGSPGVCQTLLPSCSSFLHPSWWALFHCPLVLREKVGRLPVEGVRFQVTAGSWFHGCFGLGVLSFFPPCMHSFIYTYVCVYTCVCFSLFSHFLIFMCFLRHLFLLVVP